MGSRCSSNGKDPNLAPLAIIAKPPGSPCPCPAKELTKPAPIETISDSLPHRSDNHTSKWAVSLLWLLSFLKEHPEIRSRPFTTGNVTYELIKHAVKDQGCRYVDLIEDVSAVSRGKSFFFVSHGWGRPFVELVDQLVEHFKPENQAVWRKGAPVLKHDEIYVWLDIFAINQNEGVSQGNDLSQLKEVVADCEQTLMVLDAEGSVLTRIWCLFEAWHTGKKGKDALKLLAYGVDFDALEKVFIDLEVSKAKATVQSDLTMILAEIASDVGVMKMTHQLKDALVDSVRSSIPPNDEDHPWTEALGYELFKAAKLCQLYGRLFEAEPLFSRALEGQEMMLGPDHHDTLTSVGYLARLLQEQGKLSEAESLYRRALEGREKVLGPDHPDTLTAVNSRAQLLHVQGKLFEAEPLLKRALDHRDEVLGPDHPDTLTSVGDLASLLHDQSKLLEAEPLYRRAFEGRDKVLGPYHPSTLTSMTNLALFLQDQGKLSEAEPLFERALEGCEKVLGPDHPNTLISVHNLGWLLQGQGKLSEAEPFYKRALEGCEKVLGPDHPNTLIFANSLASLFQLGKL